MRNWKEFIGVSLVFLSLVEVMPMASAAVRTAAKSTSKATASNPVGCHNGKTLTGVSGVEKTLQPASICKMFPIWSWSYPPEGGISGINGGQKTATCEQAAQSLINDLACTALGHSNFAGFLNSSNAQQNILEAAAFFAHVGKETGALGHIKEAANGQYCEPREIRCAAGKAYTGRGYHQISWNYNYHALSVFWYNNGDILLDNPERVADDMELAWGGALWFWNADRQHHSGCPEHQFLRWDKLGGTLLSGQGFGNGISVINGGIECIPSFSGHDKHAQIRVQMFFYMLSVMNENMLPPEIKGAADFVRLPYWLTEGCPFIDRVCPLKCKGVREASLGDGKGPYPSGWNDWLGEVWHLRCSESCSPEGTPCVVWGDHAKSTHKNQWPWQYISGYISGDESSAGGKPTTPEDPCKGNPCGQGTCSTSGGSYKCNCYTDYEFDGTTCKKKKTTTDPCRNNPCGNGTCNASGTSYTCVCSSGLKFNGTTCVKPTTGGTGTGNCASLETCYQNCVNTIVV